MKIFVIRYFTHYGAGSRRVPIKTRDEARVFYEIQAGYFAATAAGFFVGG